MTKSAVDARTLLKTVEAGVVVLVDGIAEVEVDVDFDVVVEEWVEDEVEVDVEVDVVAFGVVSGVIVVVEDDSVRVVLLKLVVVGIDVDAEVVVSATNVR